MAKKKRKPRTPAPPRGGSPNKGSGGRPVQAPQVRKRQRDPAVRERTMRYGLYGLGGLLVVGGAIALIAVFAFGGKKTNLNVDFAALPSVSRSTSTPWTPELNDLGLRLDAMGMRQAKNESFHIHEHLDIFVNGKRVAVPQGIGLSSTVGSPLHTHDSAGIIHDEFDTNRKFSLGEFFGVWGVYLSKKCIGGFCAKSGSPLKFYVDGQPYTRDPVTLALTQHQEIAIVYGKPPKKIPNTFNFSKHGL